MHKSYDKQTKNPKNTHAVNNIIVSDNLVRQLRVQCRYSIHDTYSVHDW